MITQKAMSLKVDNCVYDALKEEAHVSGRKTNRIIIDAIVMYVRWADMCRRIQCGSAPNIEINEYYQTHKTIMYD